jgi:ABC-type multidrug transport system ATPase subunit
MAAASQPPPALELAAVRRSFPIGLGFRRKEVLHGIDLCLPRGAVLGLVGPNGSGKSTLLRIVAGVDRASAGRVGVLGGSPHESAVRARLAYLPEDSPFPGELSARSALDLLGALAGLKRDVVRARGARLLARVGLEAAARQPLRSYSRGMLRRFGLAQAFLSEPELVLLDEPTAGLDAQGFGVLEELALEARARGATIVLASHLLSDVHDHCDRLAVLVDGRVAGAGTPGELLGLEGRRVLEVDGLDDEGLARLGAWLAEAGGALVSAKPGGRSLLELYAERRA